MAKEFPLESVVVKTVETKYRKISGKIPNEKTIEQMNKLRQFEARSMRARRRLSGTGPKDLMYSMLTEINGLTSHREF